MSKKAVVPFDGHDVGVGIGSVEQLEPRSLFSAPHDFAGVGVRFDGGQAAVFLVEGQVAENDTMTGAMRLATRAGGPIDSDLDWTRYIRGDSGALSFETRDGFTAYGSQSGMQFIREERWSMGSFSGFAEDGSLRDVAVLSEVITPEGELRDSLQGIFNLQMTRLIEGGGTETFTINVNTHRENAMTSTFTFTYNLPSGAVTVDKQLASVDGTRIMFESGEVMFLTGGFQEGVLFADFDASDGIMGVASGRMTEGGGTLVPTGQYAGTVLTTGPDSRAFLGVPDAEADANGTAVANVVIQFQYHGHFGEGTFLVYEREAFDAGMRTPVNSGTWILQVNVGPGTYFIQMTDESDRTMIAYTPARPDSRIVWFDEVNSPVDGHEELFGALESQTFRTGDIRELLAERDADGHAIAYMQLGQIGVPDSDEMLSIDLIDEVGGEAVVGKLYVWSSLGGAAIFIGGLSADGDVQVWRWNGIQIGWSYQNLTETINGAVPIATHFTGSWYESGRISSSAVGVDIFQALGGQDADGNFVAYRQVSAADSETIWEFDDSEVQGLGGGAPLPASVTEFVGYGTRWQGQNFVGLDDQGQLWAVWWAPGLSQWQVINMSELYGIETLTGNVSAMVTEWNTLHIIGTSAEDGHLIVAWWAAGFENWETEDLTDTVDGPLLEPGTLAAHFSFDLLTINFAGRDLDGNTRVYWWAPYTTWHAGWLAPASTQTPETPWQFTSAWWPEAIEIPADFIRGHSQSLLGRTDEGHLVRLVWKDTRADEWLYEDVTAVSSSYFT